MHVLHAAYNYYPHHWGGTEVYVRGLVRHLQAQGHRATVLAAIPAGTGDETGVFFEDKHLKISLYEYENTPVIGCAVHPTTDEIYSRHNPAWAASWSAFFKKYRAEVPGSDFDLLHLHASTPLVSAALAGTVKSAFPGIRTLFSYHVADSCPKGSLMYFDRETCATAPNLRICTACTLKTRLGVGEPLAKWIGAVMPNRSISTKLPSLARTKFLTGLALRSFGRLHAQVDRWLVFSPQIQVALEKLGVATKNIQVIRHGADEHYRRADRLRQPGLPQIFIYVGRFKKLKGLPTLLRAWLGLPESTDRTLWVVGDGQDLEPAFAKLVEQAKTRTDIAFLGTMDAAPLAERMAQAHCAVIPTEWVETGPLVFHEAVAAGANVIASNIGGCAALAAFYGEGCTTFEMGNVADLRSKIAQFRYQPSPKKVMDHSEHYAQVVEQYRLQKTAVLA